MEHIKLKLFVQNKSILIMMNKNVCTTLNLLVVVMVI